VPIMASPDGEDVLGDDSGVDLALVTIPLDAALGEHHLYMDGMTR